MSISFTVASSAPERTRADVLAVPIFSDRTFGPGADAVDAASGGTLARFMERSGFDGSFVFGAFDGAPPMLHPLKAAPGHNRPIDWHADHGRSSPASAEPGTNGVCTARPNIGEIFPRAVLHHSGVAVACRSPCRSIAVHRL